MLTHVDTYKHAHTEAPYIEPCVGVALFQWTNDLCEHTYITNLHTTITAQWTYSEPFFFLSFWLSIPFII